MEVGQYQCFEPGCMHDIEYSCQCTSPETYSCEAHLGKHLKFFTKTHDFASIFMEPLEDTKTAILAFLIKQKSNHIKLKRKILASFSQSLLYSENSLKEIIKNLDYNSDTINNYFLKISGTKQLFKLEKDPLLSLLNLQPKEAIKKIKIMIPENRDTYNNSKIFCDINEKVEKIIECFVKDKLKGYWDDRFARIESNLKEYSGAITLINSELENTKRSISIIINENKKTQNEFEDWKEKVKLKTKNEVSLLNNKILSITDDHNQKLKEATKFQNQSAVSLAKKNLNDKKSELLSNPNCKKYEEEFREICSSYDSDPNISFPPLMQAYQEYINTYHQKTSIYNIINEIDNKIKILVYNTETETKNSKILEVPEPLDNTTCITQLKNGNLFCYGKYPNSGVTLMIDTNNEIQELPPGTPCGSSSAIQFNQNIYCFGGNNGDWLTLSNRFDLDRNQWSKLTPMPKPDCCCNSIIFNDNILFSGRINRNILRYSIDSNCFTVIPYEFSYGKIKILINAERLYLIECENGWVYESEIANDTAWRQIAKSTISVNPWQVYCSYNKGAIYIGMERGKYWKFNLNKKKLIALK